MGIFTRSTRQNARAGPSSSAVLASKMSPPEEKRATTPLPTKQIIVLMLTRMAEPISYTVIFPFINEMVWNLGVTDNPDKVGFYSGLVESVFSLVQFFTVYHWAKLSDRIGRKPVILLGLSGVCISISLFGLTTNFWTMIIVRSMAGATNGNVAVIRAAIGDITDDTNSTEAFALFGLTWTVGAIIGNALGGTLCHPYERFPAIFGNMEIFKTHPYLLPCLVCGLITLCGIVFAQVVYDESLPRLQLSSSAGVNRTPRPSTSVSVPMSPITPTTPHPTPHHRSASTASQLSETETLVGIASSPTIKEVGSTEYPPPPSPISPSTPTARPIRTGGLSEAYEDEDDNDDPGHDSPADVTSRLLKRYPAPPTPTGAEAGEKWSKVRPKSGEWGFWDLMRWKPMRVMCGTMFLNAFVGGGWGALHLLFFFDRSGPRSALIPHDTPSRPRTLALTLQTTAIGTALSINGFWTIACQLLLLNRLRLWLGLATAYKTLTFGWIPVYFLLPKLRWLLEATETPLPPDPALGPGGPLRFGETRGWPVSIGVNAMLSFVTVVGMSNSLLMVLINYASPDRSALGAVNGISTAVGCMARVVGPSLASALFAISMDEKILGGNLWWIAMCIFAFINFAACLFVAPNETPNRLPSISEEPEEEEV